nr:MAG TPA: hypothetical protein [Caudoviricetes sp.]
MANCNLKSRLLYLPCKGRWLRALASRRKGCER